MTKTEKLFLSLIVAILIGVVSILGLVISQKPFVGGTYFIGERDFPDGIAVNGTTVVSSSRAITGSSLTSTGDLTVSDNISYGGVSQDWITGQFTNGTTTPVAVANPYGQDVFVDIFEGWAQNGTSTGALTCGTSSSPYRSSDPTDLLIDDLSMASSTLGTATTTAYFKNGDDYAGTGGLANPGTNSEDAILWKVGEYISCYFDTLYPGALTEVTNIFDGYYRIHSRWDDNF